jgi:two-component system, LuxR family, response regulator FixJ
VPSGGHVYIVDDDDAILDSLSMLFEAVGHRVHTFRRAEAFLGAAPTLPLGCLIADIRMPEMDGLELQRHLNKGSRPFPMIIITGHGDVPLAVQAMRAGALDFIEKPFAAPTILASVEMALSALEAADRRDPAELALQSKVELLSPRERQVLDGLLAGLPNKTIAFDLAISPRTVEIHRARVMDKMGARTLSQLIRLALGAGLKPR